MRPALWVFGTTAAVLLSASACTGFGESPDPGAPSTETISNILEIPGGKTVAHVGHVVVENSILYAAATSREDGYNATSWVLRMEADGPWTTISTSKNGSDPRLLVRNGTLYQAGADSGLATVQTWSSGDLEPHELCELGYGSPAGIAQSGYFLYVFLLTTGGDCGYSFDTDTFCDSAAQLVACSTVQNDAGAVAQQLLPDSRPLLSNQMVNPLVIQDRSLYWFEGVSSTGNYKGAKLLKLPVDDSADGGGAGEPTGVMSLDADSYPLGFAFSFSTGALFVASSSAVAMDSSSFSGCSIWKLAKGSAEAERILTDPSRTCRGLSADPANLVFTTSWLEGSDRGEGLMLLKAGANGFPPAFRVDRPGIGLRETILFNDSVLVRYPTGLLRIPLSMVP